MNKVTLAVVAVLLAVPAVAQAKAGIEFDTATTSMKPGDQQTFIAFVHGSGGGGQPMVAFKNDSTGQVMRVRTTLLDRNGMARGTVVFPDYGPWTATLSVDGKVVSPGDGQGFPVGSPT